MNDSSALAGCSYSQLKRLVAKKNMIECEERMFRETEARDAAKNASRFLAWAEAQFSGKQGQ